MIRPLHNSEFTQGPSSHLVFGRERRLYSQRHSNLRALSICRLQPFHSEQQMHQDTVERTKAKQQMFMSESDWEDIKAWGSKKLHVPFFADCTERHLCPAVWAQKTQDR